MPHSASSGRPESTVPPTVLAACRYARSGNESPNIGFPLLDCSCVASS